MRDRTLYADVDGAGRPLACRPQHARLIIAIVFYPKYIRTSKPVSWGDISAVHMTLIYV